MKPVSKIKLISLLTKLNEIDQELYEFLSPNERYPSQKEGWFFLGYYNVLNSIYYEFCGESEENYYKQFKACKYDREDRPIAWYKGQFSMNADGSIKGPKDHAGFIPDCINNVILSHKIDAKEKMKLLTRMFRDLKKLKTNG